MILVVLIVGLIAFPFRLWGKFKREAQFSSWLVIVGNALF
jgi:hypothetical protein